MRYLIYLFPIVLLFFTACGGGNSGNQSQVQDENTAADTQASSQQSSDEVRTIDIIGIDKMKYAVKEEGEMIGTAGTVETPQGESFLLLESIDAEPGEEIRIRLTTKSQLPAQAMSHNLVLLEMSADPAAFATAATGAKDNDYIPSDMSDQVIAHTEMAGGGETVEVTFTVPEETGEYPYLCSFPAHFSAGMKGMLSVQ
jgi:azurin